MSVQPLWSAKRRLPLPSAYLFMIIQTQWPTLIILFVTLFESSLCIYLLPFLDQQLEMMTIPLTVNFKWTVTGGTYKRRKGDSIFISTAEPHRDDQAGKEFGIIKIQFPSWNAYIQLTKADELLTHSPTAIDKNQRIYLEEYGSRKLLQHTIEQMYLKRVTPCLN